MSAVTALVVGLVAISASLVGLSELASSGLNTAEQPTTRPPTRTFDATSTASVSTTPVEPKVREIKVPARDDVPREATGATTPVPDKPSPAEPEPSLPEEGESTVVAATRPQNVDGFATVGVTWKHGVRLSPDDVAINVRTRTNNAWSEWTELETDEEDGPDRQSLESSGVQARPGTGALVVGDVDQVQLRAATIDGQPIPDLRLVVVDPGISKIKRESAAIDTAALGPSTGTNEPERATTSASSNGDEATLSAMKVGLPRLWLTPDL
ncbi:hypothetical protein [Nocardioides aurantiacus]|uniref:hypothetical protein n=1 Tax=Nocardioides aurantiacus TaxID=86796 RepID=UPI00403EFC07